MRSRIAYIVIGLSLVIVFLIGGVCGVTLAHSDIDKNTRALAELTAANDKLAMVLENQQAGAARGTETQDGLRCLLLQLSLPQDERPTQLTPELCPEVDFDQLQPGG